MTDDQIARYLYGVITGRGLTIPAAQAETYVEAKKWLWGKFHATEAKEVLVPNGPNLGVSATAGSQIPGN